MLKTREINTDFWRDEFISDLTPLEKYFYNYLITNPRASRCGAYHFDLHIAAGEMGIEEGLILKMMHFFEKCSKLIYIRETDEILLLNRYKYNRMEYGSQEGSQINAELRLIKSPRLIREFYRICMEKCRMEAEVLEKIFRDIENT